MYDLIFWLTGPRKMIQQLREDGVDFKELEKEFGMLKISASE
jgi:hypothetical protein